MPTILERLRTVCPSVSDYYNNNVLCGNNDFNYFGTCNLHNPETYTCPTFLSKRVAFYRILTKPSKITIGADPEFDVEVNDRPANAGEFFRIDDEEYGCCEDCEDREDYCEEDCDTLRDYRDREADNVFSDEIGCDGCTATGEIRPHYGNDWRELYKNVRDIIFRLKDTFGDDAKFFAGSGKNTSTGGHIHIGGLGGQPSQELLNSLDALISRPLNSISDTSRRGDYSEYGKWRSQHHGFEYRSPLSWLSSPKICKGALCVAYVLARKAPVREITTAEKLLKICNKRERRVVERFYKEIENVQKKGLVLENVEVLQAWKRGGIRSEAKYSLIRRRGDFNMDVCTFGVSLRCKIPGLVLAGAETARTADLDNKYVVFLSRTDQAYNWSREAGGSLCSGAVSINFWDASSIGLSVELRERIRLAQRALRELIKIINSEEKCVASQQ